jgi:hypothetical protein
MPNIDLTIEETGLPQAAGDEASLALSPADEDMSLPPPLDLSHAEEWSERQSQEWTDLSQDEKDHVLLAEDILLVRTHHSLHENLQIGRGLWIFQQYVQRISGATSPRDYVYRRMFNSKATPEIKALPPTKRAEFIWLWTHHEELLVWWGRLDDRARRRWNNPAVVRTRYLMDEHILPSPNTMVHPHNPHKEIPLVSPPGMTAQAERSATFQANEAVRLRSLMDERARNPATDIETAIDNALERGLQQAEDWPALHAIITRFIHKMNERYGEPTT